MSRQFFIFHHQNNLVHSKQEPKIIQLYHPITLLFFTHHFSTLKHHPTTYLHFSTIPITHHQPTSYPTLSPSEFLSRPNLNMQQIFLDPLSLLLQPHPSSPSTPNPEHVRDIQQLRLLQTSRPRVVEHFQVIEWVNSVPSPEAPGIPMPGNEIHEVLTDLGGQFRVCGT
jgi:hypothetical protein